MSQEPFSSSPTALISLDEVKSGSEASSERPMLSIDSQPTPLPEHPKAEPLAEQTLPPGATESIAPAPSAPRPNERLTPSLMLPIEQLSGDDQFRIRPESELEDVSALATDIARLGQLVPIDVRTSDGNVFQVVTGFRRVEALKFLQREQVLARVFHKLDDEEALLIALAHAIHASPATAQTLGEWRDRLDGQGKLTPSVRDMLEKALSSGDDLSPEHVESDDDEVDADELASDVTIRLGQCNQDLALLADADVFLALDAKRREALVAQLRYSIDLVDYLEKL
jgi:ParB family transcriptional regulator, chromosome partitioning protein